MFDNQTNRRAVMRGALVAACALSLSARAAAARNVSGKHIVLLGNSIFANAAYVDGGADVVSSSAIAFPSAPAPRSAPSDGSVASGVRLQLQIAPEDATHFVVSAGGNDALHHANLIGDKVSSVGEAMEKLAAVRDYFAQDYGTMLDDVVARGVPVAVCTIYDARFPDAKQRRLAALGLTIFNDCITREAAARGLALIDLRLILTADGDLANPIEPSVAGGAKIAGAIAAFAADYDFAKGRCEVFTGASAKA